MSNYQPGQSLSFLYKSASRTLYVKSIVEIPLMNNDVCTIKSSEDMDKEAEIHFEISIVDQDTSTLFKRTVLLKLLDNVNLSEPNIEKKLEALIIADMNKKGITEYKSIAFVTKPTTSETDDNTTTISSDGTIEIEELLAAIIDDGELIA